MSETKISWTDQTWNPVTGCSHVSPGCEHCYAETLSLRFGWSKKPWKAQHAAENVILHPERLHQPSRWKTPSRVFVNSMSDLFHELVPFEFIDQVFDMMEALPQHTFQILTKRPDRMRDYMRPRLTLTHSHPLFQPPGTWDTHLTSLAPGNIWLGTSVEDQRRADERIPVLLDTPAAVRFLSCEPLLGPIDLSPWLLVPVRPGQPLSIEQTHQLRTHETGGQLLLPGLLSWAICGGESGPGFRPMDLDWARLIRDQCIAAGVPFFFKQSSGPRTEMGKELDGQRWEQFPQMPVRAGAR